MIQTKTKNKQTIVEFETKDIDEQDLLKISKILEQDEQDILINLNGIENVSNKKLDLLKQIAEQNKLSICNLDSSIFALLNLMQYEKYFAIYNDENHAIEGKFEIKNRKFKIV